MLGVWRSGRLLTIRPADLPETPPSKSCGVGGGRLASVGAVGGLGGASTATSASGFLPRPNRFKPEHPDTMITTQSESAEMRLRDLLIDLPKVIAAKQPELQNDHGTLAYFPEC